MNDSFYTRNVKGEAEDKTEYFGYYAKVIEDSIVQNVRLTTIHVRLPWYIVPELLRHRVFSFSSASTRAIPTKRFLNQIKNNLVLPLSIGRNIAGMQAGEELDEESIEQVNRFWTLAAIAVSRIVEKIRRLNVHKQVANRLLMPFLWCDLLISSTTWANFLALRIHPKAAPEMQEIGTLIADALVESTPKSSQWVLWHLPFIKSEDIAYVGILVNTTGGLLNPNILPKLSKEARNYYISILFGDSDCDNRLSVSNILLAHISGARVARISYTNFEGLTDYADDFELAYKLVKDVPRHASPFEHVALALVGSYEDKKYSSNFQYPWIQARKLIMSNDTIRTYVHKGVEIK